MSESHHRLACALAPLLAKELVSELEKRSSLFQKAIGSLPQENSTSRFRSKDEREKWAELEAQKILREIRQKGK